MILPCGSQKNVSIHEAASLVVFAVILYVHKNNANANKLVSAFYDLVKNNLYPSE